MSEEVKKLDPNLPRYLDPSVIPTIFDEGLSIQGQINILFSMIQAMQNEIDKLKGE